MLKALVLPVDDLDEALVLLRLGDVIAFPTDTVYGLAALPGDAAAVKKLFAAKQRPAEKAIPILLADPADLLKVAANISPPARRLFERYWPGPLTLVVRRSPAFRDASDPDENETVAVRVPAYAPARELIRRAGGALAVTSANKSGQPAATTAAEVVKQLGRRIPLVLDGGPVEGGAESSIVDCSRDRPRLLREAALSRAELEKTALVRFS